MAPSAIPDYFTLGIQGLAGYVGGFAASPLMQISNKSCLPKVSVREVLRMTSNSPFVGATWAATRQSLSSVRGTTSIMYMRNCMEKTQQISLLDYLRAILVASAAETFIAGIPFEVPETRVQSGFSRYSWHCIKAVPFMYVRNVITCVAPAYFCREEMLLEHQSKVKSGWGSEGDCAAGSEKVGDESKGVRSGRLSAKRGRGSWASAIGYTGLMSFCMAVLGSPVQGIVGRILQEEGVTSACRNALRDFNLNDPQKRTVTALRVASRASANAITGISITVAFLFARDVMNV